MEKLTPKRVALLKWLGTEPFSEECKVLISMTLKTDSQIQAMGMWLQKTRESLKDEQAEDIIIAEAVKISKAK